MTEASKWGTGRMVFLEAVQTPLRVSGVRGLYSKAGLQRHNPAARVGSRKLSLVGSTNQNVAGLGLSNQSAV